MLTGARSAALGVTLIELLIAVSLIALLLALAGPSFRDLSLDNRQAARLNEFLVALNLARAEAVKRGLRACLCKGSAPSGCENTAGGCCDTSAAGWEQGWLVFVDRDRDSNLTAAGGDVLLQRRERLAGEMTVRGSHNLQHRVLFNNRGESGSPGTLRFCDSRGASAAKGIVLHSTGRARLAVDRDDPPDGIVEDGGGNNLECP